MTHVLKILHLRLGLAVLRVAELLVVHRAFFVNEWLQSRKLLVLSLNLAQLLDIGCAGQIRLLVATAD